jgi:3-phenylpropionate/trans-cinnamate dioxygenase ferredoxin component
MPEWFTVARAGEIEAGSARAFDVNGSFVAVVNCDGRLYAIDNVCSHAYAELAEGEVDSDDCTIECPLHGSTFDLQSGRPRTFPAVVPVATYAVRVVDDEVQVEI